MRTGPAAGLIPLIGLILALIQGTLTALANRFGPPWHSRIVVDQATLLGQPDPAAAPVGPLTRGQIVVVVSESKSSDGTKWTQTPDGWIASSQIAEDIQPWIAEVSAP